MKTERKSRRDARYELEVSDTNCEPVEHNELMHPKPLTERIGPRDALIVVLFAILLVWGMVSLWKHNDRKMEKFREAHPERFEAPPEQ